MSAPLPAIVPAARRATAAVSASCLHLLHLLQPGLQTLSLWFTEIHRMHAWAYVFLGFFFRWYSCTALVIQGRWKWLFYSGLQNSLCLHVLIVLHICVCMCFVFFCIITSPLPPPSYFILLCLYGLLSYIILFIFPTSALFYFYYVSVKCPVSLLWTVQISNAVG